MQARKRETKAGKPGKPGRQLPEPVRRVLEHVVLAASIGVLLSLVYLLFIILSGGLAAPLIAGTALVQVTKSVGLAKALFLWCLWVLVLSAMIRHYRAELPGFIAMGVGVGCWAILPLVVRSRVDPTSAQPLMELGQSLVVSFQSAGGAMIVLGIMRIVVGRIILLASPSHGASKLSGLSAEATAIAAERATERPSLLRRCYELHFCRTSLRANCPRFLEGTSCWRRKSGCYCDQGLATSLLSGIGADTRAKAAEELEAAQRRTRARRQQKKVPCGECPLYLEHQKHKYRVLSWFTYPLAAVIVGANVGRIQAGYQWVEWRLGDFLAGFQVLPRPLTDTPFDPAAWLSAQNASVLLIGVMLVGLLLSLTEMAIFKLKL